MKLVHAALDLGVRFFDTANSYGAGTSEAVLGRALGPRRDQVFLATKAGYVFRERSQVERAARSGAFRVIGYAHRLRGRATNREHATPAAGQALSPRGRQDFSPAYLRRALEESLRRLRTDYVDLFQLHAPLGVCDDDTLGLVADLQSAGIIREFGIGFETLDGVLPWLATGTVSRVQLPFGVLDPEALHQAIPAARQLRVPVIARGVFAAGLLARERSTAVPLLSVRQLEARRSVQELASEAGVDVLQVAAWFVQAAGGVDVVLIGTSSPHHLKESVSYVEARPPPAIVERLRTLMQRPTPAEHEAGEMEDDG